MCQGTTSLLLLSVDFVLLYSVGSLSKNRLAWSEEHSTAVARFSCLPLGHDCLVHFFQNATYTLLFLETCDDHFDLHNNSTLAVQRLSVQTRVRGSSLFLFLPPKETGNIPSRTRLKLGGRLCTGGILLEVSCSQFLRFRASHIGEWIVKLSVEASDAC